MVAPARTPLPDGFETLDGDFFRRPHRRPPHRTTEVYSRQLRPADARFSWHVESSRAKRGGPRRRATPLAGRPIPRPLHHTAPTLPFSSFFLGGAVWGCSRGMPGYPATPEKGGDPRIHRQAPVVCGPLSAGFSAGMPEGLRVWSGADLSHRDAGRAFTVGGPVGADWWPGRYTQGPDKTGAAPYSKGSSDNSERGRRRRRPAGTGRTGAVPDGNDRANTSCDRTRGADRADAAPPGPAARRAAHRPRHPATSRPGASRVRHQARGGRRLGVARAAPAAATEADRGPHRGPWRGALGRFIAGHVPRPGRRRRPGRGRVGGQRRSRPGG